MNPDVVLEDVSELLASLCSGSRNSWDSVEVLKKLANAARDHCSRDLIVEAEFTIDRRTLDNEEALVEVCRLYGNLCYNNDAGRALVRRQGIIPAIHTAVRALRPKSDARLLAVLPAFLQNYCISNPVSVTEVPELVATLACLMATSSDLEQLGAIVELLVTVDELEGGRTSILVTEAVCGLIVHLVGLTNADNYDQLDEDFLHLLSELVEESKMVGYFVSFRLHTVLLDRIEQSSRENCEEESRWRKWSCDLLTLLLSHVEAEASVEPLLPQLDKWLGSRCSYQTAAAALILGNYCTSETSCQQLIAICPSVVGHLVECLRSSDTQSVLHATVGCLRNLAVCRPIRPHLISAGVDDAAMSAFLHKIGERDAGVDFKLVSVLRLLSQDNSDLCRSLSRQSELQQKLAATAASDHWSNGYLAIEIGRLFCSLVRYGRDTDVAFAVLDAGGLEFIIALMSSPHIQLQNESLVVLALLSCERSPTAQLVEKLNVDLVAGRLTEVLASPDIPEELKWNAVQVVGNLLSWQLTGVTLRMLAYRDQLSQSLVPLKANLADIDRKATVDNIIAKLNSVSE